MAFACAGLAGWSGALMAGSPSEEGATPSSVVDMRNVERVRIRVWGNAELSGEYSLDHNSSISFPGLGRIDVGGMTPSELEQMLSKRLGSLTRNDVTVSIDVEQFRPFFIMGDVEQPGAIAWRPGLKVIQAVTLARGVQRSTNTGDSNSARDRTLAHHQSQTRLTFALAQLARYRAERDGSDAITAKTSIATLASSIPASTRGVLAGLVERQSDMLIEQRDAMHTQISGLQREREAVQREVEAAETQAVSVARQIEMTRELMSDIEGLWTKKLISRTRYLDQKTAMLTAEVRQAEATSMVERARARLTLIDQQIVSAPQQRRIALNERIDDLEREVAQLELASANHDDATDVQKLTYHITRETKSGVVTLPATIFADVLPGDVVVVSRAAGAAAPSEMSVPLEFGPQSPERPGLNRIMDENREPGAPARFTSDEKFSRAR